MRAAIEQFHGWHSSMNGRTSPDTDLVLLLQRISRQDKQAFEALYRAMERPLFRFVQSKLNDPFQSSDILHEVFLEVWRNAGRFEGRSSAKTWIFGIAYRKVIDVFRRNGKVELSDEMPDVADDSPDALQCMVAAQNSAMIKHCLGTLKTEHRNAIELTFYEDMSYREISEVTAVPEGTVKTRVFHAKKLLMHCLEGRMRAGS